MQGLGNASGYRATFTETKHLSMLKQPQTLEGMLVYQPPDRLKKVVTRPQEKIYDIRGQTLTISSPEGANRQIAIDRHALLRTLVTTLRGILAGELGQLRTTYQLDLEGSEQAWHLRLTPKPDSVREEIRGIHVKGRGERIRSIKTIEANGDYSLLRITQVQSR
jgi:outer membrane lipoprotein-sorting protein